MQFNDVMFADKTGFGQSGRSFMLDSGTVSYIHPPQRPLKDVKSAVYMVQLAVILKILRLKHNSVFKHEVNTELINMESTRLVFSFSIQMKRCINYNTHRTSCTTQF